MPLTLVYDATGLPVQVGDTAHTFRGDAVTVQQIQEPLTETSTGRVFVTFNDKPAKHGFNDAWSGFYPSVIGTHWEPSKSNDPDDSGPSRYERERLVDDPGGK